MKKHTLLLLSIILSLLLFGCQKTKPNLPDDDQESISKTEVENAFIKTYTAYLESSHVAFKMNISGDKVSMIELHYDIKKDVKLAYTSTVDGSNYDIYIKDQMAYINDNNQKYSQEETSSDFMRNYNFQTYTNTFYLQVLEVFKKELTIKEEEGIIFLSSKDGDLLIVDLGDVVKEITLRVTKNGHTNEVNLTFIGLNQDINFPSLDEYPIKEVSS